MRILPAISGLERLVMDQVWAQREATVRTVLEVLNEDESREPRAYTTVMTVLQRLEGKGLIARVRHGRTDVYTAQIGRDAYLAACADAEVSRLLDRYGELALVQFARRVEALDDERLAALRRLAGS